jgi:hypothetical protein
MRFAKWLNCPKTDLDHSDIKPTIKWIAAMIKETTILTTKTLTVKLRMLLTTAAALLRKNLCVKAIRIMMSRETKNIQLAYRPMNSTIFMLKGIPKKSVPSLNIIIKTNGRKAGRTNAAGRCYGVHTMAGLSSQGQQDRSYLPASHMELRLTSSRLMAHGQRLLSRSPYRFSKKLFNAFASAFI